MFTKYFHFIFLIFLRKRRIVNLPRQQQHLAVKLQWWSLKNIFLVSLCVFLFFSVTKLWKQKDPHQMSRLSLYITYEWNLENTHTKNPSQLYNNFADRKKFHHCRGVVVCEKINEAETFFSARRTNCVILRMRRRQKYYEKELKDLCQGLLEHESKVF